MPRITGAFRGAIAATEAADTPARLKIKAFLCMLDRMPALSLSDPECLIGMRARGE